MNGFAKLLAAAATVVFASDAGAADGLALSDVNVYLIWEDSGKLSRAYPDTETQILANTDDGYSTQMLVDFVLTAPPDTLFENTPRLKVMVMNGDQEVIVDKSWPVTYVAAAGKLVRTAVADHNCNPVTLTAWIETDGKPGPVFERQISLTCGD